MKTDICKESNAGKCPKCNQGLVLPVVFSNGVKVFVCEECSSVWKDEELTQPPVSLKEYLKSLKT